MAQIILSKNFTLAELLRTDYPQYQRNPSTQQIINLATLCATILQPLRDKFGKPIIITSGFRSAELNKKIGGVQNSYHLQGLAADIRIKSDTDAQTLFSILHNIAAVDSALIEHNKSGARWLHVQTSITRTPRRIYNDNYFNIIK